MLGYPDRALERISIATAIAHECGAKSALQLAHDVAIYVYDLCRELEQMRQRAEALLALSVETGSIFHRAQSEFFPGWADALAGDLEGGVARMRHQRLQFSATGAEVMSDYWLALIATALGRVGQFDEGLRTIDESFPFVERTGQRFYEAEVHRLKGELLLAKDTSKRRAS